MRRSALVCGLLIAVSPFAACVGDDPSAGPTANDGGSDGTTSSGDSSTGDGSTSDANIPDVGVDSARPDPTPVGTFGWKNIYPTENSTTEIAYAADGSLFVAIDYTMTFNADTTHTFTFAGGADDIAVLKLDPNGAILWATSYSTSSTEHVESIASDGTDLYLSGYFDTPTLDFGNGKTVSPIVSGETDPFVVKLRGTDGQAQWAQNFASPSATQGYSRCDTLAFGGGRLGAACTSSRGMQFTLTTGASAATPQINSAGTMPISNNFFVASLDPGTGKAFWASGFGGDDQTIASAMALDSTGNVAMTVSSFATNVTDSTGSLNWSNSRGHDRPAFFTMKLRADGHALWTTTFNDSAASNTDESDSAVNDVAFNSHGDVIVSGRVVGTVPIGTKTVVSHDTTMGDAFVADLDGTSGATNWALPFGGTKTENPASLSVDPWDDIVIVGTYFSTDFAVGAKILPAPNGQGSYVLKLDSAGNVFWGFATVASADAAASTLNLAGNVVAVDPYSGGVSWIGNAYQTAVDFGDGAPVVLGNVTTNYLVHRAP